ncbi:hypothetical protein ES707_06234 [subsurface metagenome]
MVLVSTQHTIRLFNFDSEVDEILLDTNLKILKSVVSEKDKRVMQGDIHFNIWPNYVIQKTYNINYKTPEYAVLSTDYLNSTLSDLARVLDSLRLYRNSAIFFDHQIVAETFENGKKKFSPSNIIMSGYTRFSGKALIINALT